MSIPTSAPQAERHAQRPVAPIRPIPFEGAAFVVTIDGRPYAGFINRSYAEMAVGLWSGEIDGFGEPVPPRDRARHGWAAVRGRRLEIVDNDHPKAR